jgi:hypothetical protein
MVKEEYKTIRYFKAEQLKDIAKSEEANSVLSSSSPQDSIAVLLTITNPAKIEKAVNITKGGFGKIKDLVPV